MPTIPPSHRDVGILNSLTTFFNSQNGEKTAKQLHAEVIQHVFRQHTVIWVEPDVKSVLRAAAQRGSAIEHEIKLDAARTARYEEAKEYIANHSQTRTSAKKATEEKQPIIDEYNNIADHKHTALTLAQLALHRAVVGLSEKGKQIKADNEEEERKVQAAIKQQRRDEAKAKAEEKAKTAEEKAQKKREDAAARATAEALNTRAINNEKARALVEHNKDRYKRKREDAELRREFSISGLKVMNLILDRHAAEQKNDVDEEEDDKENQEINENIMPA